MIIDRETNKPVTLGTILLELMISLSEPASSPKHQSLLEIDKRYEERYFVQPDQQSDKQLNEN